MSGVLTGAAIAMIAGAIALYLMKKKAYPKIVPYLMLMAGLGLAGMAGNLLDWIGRALVGSTASLSRTLGGAAVPMILTFVIGLALFLALKPKGPGVTKWTPWLALVYPAVLVATGGMAADLGALLQEGFGSGSTAVLSSLAQMLRDAR